MCWQRRCCNVPGTIGEPPAASDGPYGPYPPGSSIHRILWVRILKSVAMPFSRGSSWPRDWNCVSCVFCTAGRFFSHWATWGNPCGNTSFNLFQASSWNQEKYIILGLAWLSFNTILLIHFFPNIPNHPKPIIGICFNEQATVFHSWSLLMLAKGYSKGSR